MHMQSYMHTQDHHKLCLHSSPSRHQITTCCLLLCPNTPMSQHRPIQSQHTPWKVDSCVENNAQQSAAVMKQTGGTCKFLMLSSKAKIAASQAHLGIGLTDAPFPHAICVAFSPSALLHCRYQEVPQRAIFRHSDLQRGAQCQAAAG